MKKKLLITAAFLLMIAVTAVVNFFFIGEPVDAAQLSVQVTPAGDKLTVEFHSVESALALRDVRTRYDGQTIRITARKVPVTVIFPSGSHRLVLEITDITQVIFADTVIWSTP